MDYFHYTYKHNHIDFNSDIYKVSTYHYNWHSGVEVLILLKGRIDMSCNSEVFTMEPLDTIIISPQVGHATLAFAAQMMLLMVNSESPDRQLWLESHFLAMTSDIYREIDAVKTIPIHTKPADMTVATFDKMIAYIDENYKQKIELEDIAKIGGYNVNYTSQFFKRQLGVSFLEYLLRLRLREATVRLANSEDGVAHIASSCGFADIKAFNVAFKKHFHTTPSEYRKQAKEMGRKTKLHDWKEIISTQEEDIIDILQTYLPYQDVSIDKNRLDEANQKLQDVRDQLEMVVKRL
ncbi:MAG: helix-turn-helix domain-containing protein, partial [Veillonella sp.]|nr:helix-turn-helix domain-containing protein [Veillonella sp.]